jgi:hypothetical protein
MFDSYIREKQWLIFFVFDRHSDKYEVTNEYLYYLMGDVAKLTLGETIVAFVDVMDEGESLKETFDIETTPSIVWVKDQLVTHLPKKQHYQPQDFTDFIQSNNNVKELQNYLRKRVIGLNLYKEYAAKYLAENHFDDFMPQFLHAKRLV